MKLTSKDNCPVRDLKPCEGLECKWFIQIRGVNPNTGEPVDEFDCVMRWNTILQIEQAQKINQLAASIDKLATAMQKVADKPVLPAVLIQTPPPAAAPAPQLADAYSTKTLPRPTPPGAGPLLQ